MKRDVVSSAQKLAMKLCKPDRPIRVTTIAHEAVDKTQIVGTAMFLRGKPAWVPGEAKDWRVRSVAGPEGRGYLQSAFEEGRKRFGA